MKLRRQDLIDAGFEPNFLDACVAYFDIIETNGYTPDGDRAIIDDIAEQHGIDPVELDLYMTPKEITGWDLLWRRPVAECYGVRVSVYNAPNNSEEAR